MENIKTSEKKNYEKKTSQNGMWMRFCDINCNIQNCMRMNSQNFV